MKSKLLHMCVMVLATNYTVLEANSPASYATTAQLDSVSGNVAALGTRVSAVEGRVDTFENALKDTDDQIISVSGLQGNIAALQGNVTALQGNIGDVNVATLSENVATLQNKVGEVNIAELSTTVSGLNTSLQTLEESVTALQGNIGEAEISELSATLTSVQENLQAARTAISALESKVGDSNVPELSSSVSTLSNSLDTVKDNVQTLQSNVNAMKTQIGDVAVTDLDSNVTLIQGQLNNLQTSVSTLQGSVTTLRQLVGQIAEGEAAPQADLLSRVSAIEETGVSDAYKNGGDLANAATYVKRLLAASEAAEDPDDRLGLEELARAVFNAALYVRVLQTEGIDNPAIADLTAALADLKGIIGSYPEGETIPSKTLIERFAIFEKRVQSLETVDVFSKEFSEKVNTLSEAYKTGGDLGNAVDYVKALSTAASSGLPDGESANLAQLAASVVKAANYVDGLQVTSGDNEPVTVDSKDVAEVVAGVKKLGVSELATKSYVSGFDEKHDARLAALEASIVGEIADGETFRSSLPASTLKEAVADIDSLKTTMGTLPEGVSVSGMNTDLAAIMSAYRESGGDIRAVIDYIEQQKTASQVLGSDPNEVYSAVSHLNADIATIKLANAAAASLVDNIQTLKDRVAPIHEAYQSGGELSKAANYVKSLEEGEVAPSDIVEATGFVSVLRSPDEGTGVLPNDILETVSAVKSVRDRISSGEENVEIATKKDVEEARSSAVTTAVNTATAAAKTELDAQIATLSESLQHAKDYVEGLNSSDGTVGVEAADIVAAVNYVQGLIPGTDDNEQATGATTEHIVDAANYVKTLKAATSAADPQKVTEVIAYVQGMMQAISSGGNDPSGDSGNGGADPSSTPTTVSATPEQMVVAADYIHNLTTATRADGVEVGVKSDDIVRTVESVKDFTKEISDLKAMNTLAHLLELVKIQADLGEIKATTDALQQWQGNDGTLTSTIEIVNKLSEAWDKKGSLTDTVTMATKVNAAWNGEGSITDAITTATKVDAAWDGEGSITNAIASAEIFNNIPTAIDSYQKRELSPSDLDPVSRSITNLVEDSVRDAQNALTTSTQATIDYVKPLLETTGVQAQAIIDASNYVGRLGTATVTTDDISTAVAYVKGVKGSGEADQSAQDSAAASRFVKEVAETGMDSNGEGGITSSDVANATILAGAVYQGGETSAEALQALGQNVAAAADYVSKVVEVGKTDGTTDGVDPEEVANAAIFTQGFVGETLLPPADVKSAGRSVADTVDFVNAMKTPDTERTITVSASDIGYAADYVRSLRGTGQQAITPANIAGVYNFWTSFTDYMSSQNIASVSVLFEGLDRRLKSLEDSFRETITENLQNTEARVSDLEGQLKEANARANAISNYEIPDNFLYNIGNYGITSEGFGTAIKTLIGNVSTENVTALLAFFNGYTDARSAVEMIDKSDISSWARFVAQQKYDDANSNIRGILNILYNVTKNIALTSGNTNQAKRLFADILDDLVDQYKVECKTVYEQDIRDAVDAAMAENSSNSGD